MKSKLSPKRAGLLTVAAAVILGVCGIPAAKAQPKLGLFAPPNTGAPKTRVGGGVRGGLMLPNTGAPKTRIGGGVRGGLMLPNTGAPKATAIVSRLLIVRLFRSVTITQSSAIANPASNT